MPALKPSGWQARGPFLGSMSLPAHAVPTQLPTQRAAAPRRSRQGTVVSIVQDLPISKPFVPSEIDRVAAAKAVVEYAPCYLDLLSGGPRLQSVIERIKSLGSVLTMATCNVGGAQTGAWIPGHAHGNGTCVARGAQLAHPALKRSFAHPHRCKPSLQNGDLHVQVSATNVMLGAQLQGLTVVPASESCWQLQAAAIMHAPCVLRPGLVPGIVQRPCDRMQVAAALAGLTKLPLMPLMCRCTVQAWRHRPLRHRGGAAASRAGRTRGHFGGERRAGGHCGLHAAWWGDGFQNMSCAPTPSGPHTCLCPLCRLPQQVHVKHLAKVLAVSPLSSPHQILCGMCGALLIAGPATWMPGAVKHSDCAPMPQTRSTATNPVYVEAAAATHANPNATRPTPHHRHRRRPQPRTHHVHLQGPYIHSRL